MKVEVDRLIAKPSRDVWAILSDWTNAHAWLPMMRHCDGDAFAVGAMRKCFFEQRTFGKDFVEEQVVEIGRHYYKLAIQGGIGPWRKFHVTWNVDSVSSGACNVRLGMEVPGGALKWLKRLLLARQLRKLSTAILVALAEYIDSGAQPVPAEAVIHSG